MIVIRLLVLLALVLDNVTANLCCSNQDDDFIYAVPNTEHVIENSTVSAITENTTKLCVTEATEVYERNYDVDMKYVQDSITALWRIIFTLIFILILLVFLISYVSSLIRNNTLKANRIVNYAVTDAPCRETPQLYFPVINGTRTANFLKDLDPIYDYPCSLQSDYERV